MKTNISHLLLKLLVAFVIAIIYFPTVIIMILSFNKAPSVTFPITEFSLDWYIKKPIGSEYAALVSLMYDWGFWDALRNSIIASFIVAFLAAFLVTSSALALRYKLRGRTLFFFLLLMGFLLPGATLGLGVVLLHKIFGWDYTIWSIVLVNTVYTVPFGLLLMMARFDPQLAEYERAASTLKAGPLQTFRRVTFPLIKWEVISAAIIGFLLSWGELIRTQFVVRGIGVVSTYIYNQLCINPLTPKWYAAGTIIAVVAFIGVFIIGTILGRGARERI